MSDQTDQSTFPSLRYRLHVGRHRFTLIRNPQVRLGCRRFRGRADAGIPRVGVVGWMHMRNRHFGFERLR